MFPHIRHTSIFSIAVCRAAASGAISGSRDFDKNNSGTLILSGTADRVYPRR
jgi:hypothetical protein